MKLVQILQSFVDPYDGEMRWQSDATTSLTRIRNRPDLMDVLVALGSATSGSVVGEESL